MTELTRAIVRTEAGTQIRPLTGTEAQLRVDLTKLHQRGDLIRFVDRRPQRLRRRTPWGPRRYLVRVELYPGSRLLPIPSATNESRFGDIERAAVTALALTGGGVVGLVALVATIRAHLAAVAGYAMLALLVAALVVRLVGGGRSVMVGGGCGCIIIHICGH